MLAGDEGGAGRVVGLLRLGGGRWAPRSVSRVWQSCGGGGPFAIIAGGSWRCRLLRWLLLLFLLLLLHWGGQGTRARDWAERIQGQLHGQLRQLQAQWHGSSALHSGVLGRGPRCRRDARGLRSLFLDDFVLLLLCGLGSCGRGLWNRFIEHLRCSWVIVAHSRHSRRLSWRRASAGDGRANACWLHLRP